MRKAVRWGGKEGLREVQGLQRRWKSVQRCTRAAAPGEREGMDEQKQGSSIKVVQVQDGGGMGGRSRASDDPDRALGRAAALALGDSAALLTFAAIGRSNHGEALSFAGLASTVAPFALAWLPCAAALGAFGPNATCGRLLPSLRVFAYAFAAFVPTSVGLRTLAAAHAPAPAFIAISSAFTFTLLGGWRASFALAVPKSARAGSRQGGPIEFFRMLSGLVRRW